jgi:hypothetical protein
MPPAAYGIVGGSRIGGALALSHIEGLEVGGRVPVVLYGRNCDLASEWSAFEEVSQV